MPCYNGRPVSAPSVLSIAARIAEELNVRVPQVDAAIALLDEATQALLPLYEAWKTAVKG